MSSRVVGANLGNGDLNVDAVCEGGSAGDSDADAISMLLPRRRK